MADTKKGTGENSIAGDGLCKRETGDEDVGRSEESRRETCRAASRCSKKQVLGNLI